LYGSERRVNERERRERKKKRERTRKERRFFFFKRWKCICLPDRKKRGPTDFPLEDITSGDPKPAESSSEAAPSTAPTTGETPSSASSPTGETPSTVSSNQGETAATTEGEGKVAVLKKKVDNDVEIPPAATNKKSHTLILPSLCSLRCVLSLFYAHACTCDRLDLIILFALR